MRYLFATIFIFTYHSAILVYVNSSYLAQFVSQKYVGLIYTIASVVTILALTNFSKLLTRLHPFKLLIASFLIDLLAIAGFLTFKNSWAVVLAFIIYYVSVLLVRVALMDIYLEGITRNENTGKTRGVGLTFINLAFLVSPLTVSLLMKDGNFSTMFVLALALGAPILLLLFWKVRGLNHEIYHRVPFWHAVREVRADRSIFAIMISHFLLNFFYAWMVIYLPIYLRNQIGLEWSQIGIIFTIMLIPFVIFDIPLGRLADIKWGEKEMLIAGFAVAGFSTLGIFFISSTTVAVWAAVLLLTRVGAATIEIMNETYFFKKVKPDDTALISLFRDTEQSAYIVAPLAASVVLQFFDYRFLFLILGLVMLYGIRFALHLRDTR